MTESGVEGRVIIVTGGGGGVGAGLVRHFTENGAKVVVAEWNKAVMDATVAEIRAAGGDVLGVETNVQSRESIFAMVEKTVDHYGRVDGIVNNAMTILPQVPVMELDEKTFDVELTSGLKGTLWGMQAVYPHMARQGWGRIVNVGSAAGLVGFPNMASYSAVKEGVRSLSRSAAREWFGDGICVNVYCPSSMGHIHRDPAAAVKVAQSQGAQAAMEFLSPHGRDGDAKDDIGPAVAFMLSDGARFMTGQTVTLDCGAWVFA